MTQSPSPKKKTTKEPPSAAILLLMTTADTTWRMFVPTIGFVLIGVALDDYFDTLPWLSLAGLLIGSVIAGLLIRQLLKKDID
jgi:hypothetical protein